MTRFRVIEDDNINLEGYWGLLEVIRRGLGGLLGRGLGGLGGLLEIVRRLLGRLLLLLGEGFLLPPAINNINNLPYHQNFGYRYGYHHFYLLITLFIASGFLVGKFVEK